MRGAAGGAGQVARFEMDERIDIENQTHTTIAENRRTGEQVKPDASSSKPYEHPLLCSQILERGRILRRRNQAGRGGWRPRLYIHQR